MIDPIRLKQNLVSEKFRKIYPKASYGYWNRYVPERTHGRPVLEVVEKTSKSVFAINDDKSTGKSNGYLPVS